MRSPTPIRAGCSRGLRLDASRQRRTSAEKNLSPVSHPPLSSSRLAHSRASSIAMSETEHGVAVHIMIAAVEPREAQRPTSLAARTPIMVSPLATGDTAVGALAGPPGSAEGPTSLVSLVGAEASAPWRLPALHPLIRGETETGIRASPAARKNNPPGGGALARTPVTQQCLDGMSDRTNSEQMQQTGRCQQFRHNSGSNA